MRAWQALQTLCSRQARLVTRECPALKPMNWEAELQDIANFRWKTWHKWNTGSMVTQSFFCRPTTDPSGKQIQWEIMRKQSSNKTYSCFGADVLPRPYVHKAASVTDAKAGNPGWHACANGKVDLGGCLCSGGLFHVVFCDYTLLLWGVRTLTQISSRRAAPASDRPSPAQSGAMYQEIPNEWAIYI